jgi:hypothetical protein
MSWRIEQTADGSWDWSCVQSAFGAAVGNAPTLAQAKVELAIAEAAITDHAYPPEVEQAMLADPERFAASMQNPKDVS